MIVYEHQKNAVLVAFFAGLKRPAFVVNQSEIINEKDSNNMTSNYRGDESKREERGNYKEETGSNKESERKEKNNRKEENNHEEASESKREGENEEKPKTYRDPDILQELYDNETPYEELITKRYSAEEMEKLEELANRYKYITLFNVFPYIDVEYRFECVREGNRMNYVLFQGEDRSLLCIFFDKTSYEIYQVEQFSEFYSLKDFEMVLRPGITTVDDVEVDFGELSRHLKFENIRSRVVKEGTILFLLEPQPQNMSSVYYDMIFFPDGEGLPTNYEKMPSFGNGAPEMLAIDKHIASGGKEMRSEDTLLDLIDNETPYEELITKKYPSEDMERIKRIMNGHKDFSMLELFPYVDIDYPFECVRSADRVNYVMFQGEDESLLCVFFNKSTLKICQVEQFYKFYSVEDFEGKLQSRVTKKEDIEAVFGKLEKHLSYETVADRIVKEGTLFFIFKIKPHGLIFYEAYLFRDGETFPDGYDYMPVFGVDGPELLPMDKHIGKEDEKKSAEKSNLV
ncbi:MAG: hypothetical protein HFG53_10290 [Lachnospiraceae bacterium]|nr:hypothetical protein [Lachnospiraceae bacterium]